MNFPTNHPPPPPFQPQKGDILITTDQSLFDLDVIHSYLTRSYWAAGIPRETVARSIRHSLCFAILESGRQIGFARVISDLATFAYLADVFVLETHQGRGLGKLLMAKILVHPDLQGLRRWCLLTADAHGLYSQFGFEVGKSPERYMEVVNRRIYSAT